MHYTVWIALSVFYRLISLTHDSDETAPMNILEVGSYSFTGLRAASVFELTRFPVFNFPSFNYKYVGVDHVAGPNVDLVVKMDTDLPYLADTFDVIISSSAFEHDQMFWVTFLDMMRVLKPNGMLFLQAPSQGIEHRTPTDNWRFYRDAPFALAKWARRNGYKVDVATSYIHDSKETRKISNWNDHTMIFWKHCENCNVAQSSSNIKDNWNIFGEAFEEYQINPLYVFAYFDVTNHTLFEHNELITPSKELVQSELEFVGWA
jgi:SAM-dependent methyltransferase